MGKALWGPGIRRRHFRRDIRKGREVRDAHGHGADAGEAGARPRPGQDIPACAGHGGGHPQRGEIRVHKQIRGGRPLPKQGTGRGSREASSGYG